MATLRDSAPFGDRWVHEIKFDGYRVQMHVRERSARFFTRQGHDWTDRFKAFAVAAWNLRTDGAVLDGEVIVPAEDGTSDFGALESDIAKGTVSSTYSNLDGFDLRAVPFIDRRQVLSALMESPKHPLRLSEHFEAEGKKLYDNACRLGLEGLVSKRRNARYTSGRTPSWTALPPPPSSHHPSLRDLRSRAGRSMCNPQHWSLIADFRAN